MIIYDFVGPNSLWFVYLGCFMISYLFGFAVIFEYNFGVD